MASVFAFGQGCQLNLGTVFDIGAGAGDNEFNFMNADATAALTPVYSANSIAAGLNSFSVAIRGHWTGVFNSIGSIFVWWTKVLTGYGTGADITASVQGAVFTPAAATDGDATAPITQGTGLTPTYGANFSQWTRHQLDTVNVAPIPGDGGASTLNIQWTES